MTGLRIIFMGTADFAVPSLKALAESEADRVVLVVTQPDREKGRQLKKQPPPVKAEADRQGLPVAQPERLRSPDVLEQLREHRPDLIVVAAYGKILAPPLLELPRWGCLNVHGSLLPLFRGAAPIQWALLEGETETGVTIMKMDAGMDTGDILLQERTPIYPEDTAATLHDRLAALGAGLLKRAIPAFISGALTPTPQEQARATYTRKIEKEDGRIDWGRPAGELFNRIRAFTPWPGAFTYWRDSGGKTRCLKIWEARPVDRSGEAGEALDGSRGELVVGCGEGSLSLLKLQIEGGRPLDAKTFLAGRPIPPGTRFERAAE